MTVSSRFRRLSALLLLTASHPALAQTPVPEATGLPPITFSLPGTPSPAPTLSAPLPTPSSASSASSPVTPVPAVTPAPRATPVPRATPTTRATPTARATAPVSAPVTPEARSTPAPQPASTVAPEQATAVDAPPAPSPKPLAPMASASDASAASGDGAQGWWYLPLGLLLVAGVAGALLWRRRGGVGEDAIHAVPTAEAGPTADAEPPLEVAPAMPSAPPVEPVPTVPPASVTAAAPRMLARRAAPPPPVTVPTERAWIELELRARRAGLNLLTATADVEVLVRNRGQADAGNVRLDVRLTSARADQDAELGQIFADAQGRLAAPAFTLPPGGERVVRALVTLPRAAINVLTAADRPMFVPVVTLNARYALHGGSEGQTAQAFALGIERAGAAKLAPLWLDTPSKMFEAVAARPHALSIAS